MQPRTRKLTKLVSGWGSHCEGREQQGLGEAPGEMDAERVYLSTTTLFMTELGNHTRCEGERGEQAHNLLGKL